MQGVIGRAQMLPSAGLSLDPLQVLLPCSDFGVFLSPVWSFIHLSTLQWGCDEVWGCGSGPCELHWTWITWLLLRGSLLQMLCLSNTGYFHISINLQPEWSLQSQQVWQNPPGSAGWVTQDQGTAAWGLPILLNPRSKFCGTCIMNPEFQLRHSCFCFLSGEWDHQFFLKHESEV